MGRVSKPKVKKVQVMTITKMLKNRRGQQNNSSVEVVTDQAKESFWKIKEEKQEVKEEVKSPRHKLGSTKLSAITKVKKFESKNTSITDYYSVRRSERRCQKTIEEENFNKTIKKIVMDEESGIEVREISNKGRGVVTTRSFSRNEFVVEYAGDLIDLTEAARREEIYSKDTSIGCYMYYFQSGGKSHCIDATAESGRLGRLLNHSRTDPNCYTKVVWFRNEMRRPKQEMPHLTIVARRDIQPGEELTYDYGDREKKSLKAHPWLKA